jgi:tetratricopeptide (TPR) repeat protein
MSDAKTDAKAIFLEALDCKGADELLRFLEQACGADGVLRARVEELLRAHQDAGAFLGGAEKQEATRDQCGAERPGTIIGSYKLLEQIGEGGFGLVFMAEQQQPVRRKVALKVLKPGMDTRQVIARFEAERQALALMDHPNIAKVLDAGETGSGHPHFVMELVKGVPITDYCDQNRLTTRERLALFPHVCHAVQHAHHKGIIHRDLKPSNVMVTLHDGVPVVKVIDFGIAKALGQQLTDKTLFTGFAQMVGTPMYMSPEQAQLSGLDIDTRSDIYSLGVLLYELLAGVTPYDRERMRTVGYDEIRRIIREEDPPSPSTRLSTLGQAAVTVSAERHSDPKRLCRLLRGELDWIVMKALDKDRNRRYETANELGRDVDRYLNDEPVAACPPSTWYRFRKFTRRHKAGLRITAAAVLVLLLAGAGVSWAILDQAARRRELSSRRADTEQIVTAVLTKTQQLRKQAAEAPSMTSQEAGAAVTLWRQAEASLEQAEAALRTGTADARVQEQVQDERRQTGRQRELAQRRANLLRDVDDARMTRSISIETHFDLAGADTKYAAAFAAYGLEVMPGRTEELARLIRAERPAIRDALIVALEDWGNTAREAKRLEWAELLEAIAAAADDDPWRRQYRLAATGKDATALRALSAQARRMSLPPSSLYLLALHLNLAGDRDEALALLRWARGAHVTDFWIHSALGHVLYKVPVQSPVNLEETIGCYRTALALRPAASNVHILLAIALKANNQLDEAIAEYRKAIELNPKRVIAHNNLGGVLLAKNQLDEAIAEYRKAIELNPSYSVGHRNLGDALLAKQDVEGAIRELHTALEIGPDDGEFHFVLARCLHAKNDLEGAIREYRAAIKRFLNESPHPHRLSPQTHIGLGAALLAKKDVEGASREFEAALRIKPNDASVHEALGHALKANGKLDEAIGEFRKAIDIDPNRACAHDHLGNALRAKGQLDEAIGEHRKAIDIDPKCASAHTNLGYDLRAKGQLEDAITEYKKAIDIDPTLAWAHEALGIALKAKNQLDEAIALYRKAIELDPKSAGVHYNLALVLVAKNQLDPAVTEFRKAIELDPKLTIAHYNLGSALQAKNQLDEASAQYRQVIDLQTDQYAEANCALAGILKSQGQLSASLDFYQRGHASGSKRKDWRHPSAQWVADAERLVRLEAKLADFLAGKAAATDNGERLGLAEVCYLKRKQVAAARFYADAFTADPKLADDRRASHRYNAACAAALAAAGQVTDADKLDETEKARLRQQALAWLRVDLKQWARGLEAGKPKDRKVIRAMLEHWQRDTDLASVRDADAIQKLTAQEQEAWRKLWADMAELLKKAGDAKS